MEIEELPTVVVEGEEVPPEYTDYAREMILRYLNGTLNDKPTRKFVRDAVRNTRPHLLMPQKKAGKSTEGHHRRPFFVD